MLRVFLNAIAKKLCGCFVFLSRSVPFLKAFSKSVEKKIKIFYYFISKNRGALIKAEIIPVELRMKFQPDPDNAGGGRYEKIFYF